MTKRRFSMELSEREKEEDMLFLDTVQNHKGQDDMMQLVQIVMNHFRFGYSGYNGFFMDVSEMFDEIEFWLKHSRKESTND